MKTVIKTKNLKLEKLITLASTIVTAISIIITVIAWLR